MSTTPISPKVTAGAAVGALVGLALQVVGLITPDMFTGLGKWSGPAYLVVTLAAGALAAYYKKDPLRVPAAAAVFVTAPAAPPPVVTAEAPAPVPAVEEAPAPIEPVFTAPPAP